MADFLQPSFAKGEVAPALYARTDTALYRVALRSAYNIEIHPQGGASNRPGTMFLCPAKVHTAPPRLIPFIFSDEDQYVLEFGDAYMRVIRNDAQVLDSSTTKTITGITNANPGVVTAVAHGRSNGDHVYISGVVGMTEVNGRWFIVANKTTDTFELTDQVAGANVNTTNYTAYSSAGSVSKVYEITTPYAIADLMEIRYVQKNDVMTLTHPDYAIRDLTRTDHDAWSFSTPTFNPTTDWPTGVTVTAGVVGDRRARYTVTAIGEVDESLAGLSNDSTTINAATKANPCAITTTASHGYSTGDEIYITGVLGMTELNGRRFFITVTGATTFTLNNEDSTGHTTYSSAGTVRRTFDEITLANISAATQANPCVLTVSNGHGIIALDEVLIDDVAGMTELNKRRFVVSAETSTTITLDNENSTSYTAYSSGGAIWRENTALNTITWTAVTGAKRYVVYKEKNGLFGKIGETEQLTFTDNNAFVDLTVTPPQFVELFDDAGEYPTAVSYFEQRKVYGGASNTPDRSDYSRTGTLNDFTSSVPLQADDAFSASLPSTSLQQIKHYVSLDNLIVFTGGGEWKVSEGSDSGFSFDTIRQRIQTKHGSGRMQPIVAGSIILFTEENLAQIRTFNYSLADDKYKGIDLTIQATHMFEKYALVDWDYAHAPDGRIYMIRADGIGVMLTFNEEQEVVAFSRMETDGDFERVCTLRHNSTELDDRVYFVVERTINSQTVRYIERRDRTTTLTVEESTGLAAVQWSISGAATIDEGNTGTYTVSYSGTIPSGQTATIAVNSASGTADSGTDFTALATTLTFTGGGVTSKTVAVSTIDDTAVEGVEAFTVALSGQSTGTLSTSQATTEIVDDDTVTPPSYAHTASDADTSNNTAYTFSGLSIGTAATGRVITVVVSGSADQTSSDFGTVTIDGNSMTQIATKRAAATGPTAAVGMYRYTLATGTTATFVVNSSGAKFNNCSIEVYAMYDLTSSVPVDSDTASATSSSSAISATLTTTANDIVIAGVMCYSQSLTFTWSGGATEDNEEAWGAEPGTSSSASGIATGASTAYAATPSGTATGMAWIGAAFR